MGAAGNDGALLAAGAAKMAVGAHPPEIAGHEVARRIERPLRRLLIVKIAEHGSGAAPADLSHLANLRLDVAIVAAPDADLVAGAGAAGGLDDQTRIVAGKRVLMRAGFGHAVAALRYDTSLEQARHQLRRCR